MNPRQQKCANCQRFCRSVYTDAARPLKSLDELGLYSKCCKLMNRTALDLQDYFLNVMKYLNFCYI